MSQENRIYTCTGDKGVTRSLSGEVLPKDNCLIEVSGDLDSLQASIDKLLAFSPYSKILADHSEVLKKIQVLLWQLGGEISSRSVSPLVKRPISDEDLEELEMLIDSFNLDLDGFQRFSNLAAIEVNESRVRTRKFERSLTSYLRESHIKHVSYKFINRLSDFFFALAVAVEKDPLNLK